MATAFLGSDVLEVGAGIGSNTALLRGFAKGRWLCVEPDPTLANRLATLAEDSGLLVDIHVGTIRTLSTLEDYDCVLYIDVLEHIADDARELMLAAARVRWGGHLLVLVPAHPRMFGPFDRSIGHFRRYSKASLSAIRPAGVTLEKIVELDSLGLLLLALNLTFFKISHPTRLQLLFWDRLTVPLSRVTDRVLNYRLGKSIFAAWRKQ